MLSGDTRHLLTSIVEDSSTLDSGSTCIKYRHVSYLDKTILGLNIVDSCVPLVQCLPSPLSAGLSQRCLSLTSSPPWKSWRSAQERWWLRRSSCAWRARRRWTVKMGPSEMSLLCFAETCTHCTLYSSAMWITTGRLKYSFPNKCGKHTIADALILYIVGITV